MSSATRDRQTKNHSTSTAAKPVEPPQKTAHSAVASTYAPAWTSVWGNQPPVGLFFDETATLPRLQAKLTINQPDDPYEQEADRVADQVMRTPAPTAQVQRKCACGGIAEPTGECEACAAKRKALQRRATQQASESTAPPIVNQVLSSGNGQPLDAGTRAFMEPRFGTDFSQIRVYTDAEAAESAQSVSALAYTIGSDVVFGRGQYQPGTSGGQKLLAHELTHVVQQSGNSTSTVREKTDRKIARTPDLDLPRLDQDLFWGDPLSQTFGVIGHSATCKGQPSLEIIAYVYPHNTTSSPTSTSGSSSASPSGGSSSVPQAPSRTGGSSEALPTPPIPSSRTVTGQPDRSEWRLSSSGLFVPARRALVVGGIHGDERGPLALVDQLQQELASATNPCDYSRGGRAGD